LKYFTYNYIKYVHTRAAQSSWPIVIQRWSIVD